MRRNTRDGTWNKTKHSAGNNTRVGQAAARQEKSPVECSEIGCLCPQGEGCSGPRRMVWSWQSTNAMATTDISSMAIICRAFCGITVRIARL